MQNTLVCAVKSTGENRKVQKRKEKPKYISEINIPNTKNKSFNSKGRERVPGIKIKIKNSTKPFHKQTLVVCLLCTCTALCTPSPLVSTSDSQTHGETHFLTKSIFIPICSNARRNPGKPVPKSAAVQRQLKRRSETKSKRGKEKKQPRSVCARQSEASLCRVTCKKSSSGEKTVRAHRRRRRRAPRSVLVSGFSRLEASSPRVPLLSF